MRCIIIDEHAQTVQSLKTFIKKIPFLEFTASFPDLKTALDFLKDNSADLIFFDIRKSIPAGNHSISDIQQHGLVILLSSNRKFAFDGFEHNVLDFLIKPLSIDRFFKAAEKAYKLRSQSEHPKQLTQIEPLKGGFIFIKESTRLIRVELDEIYYVMGLKNYVSIHTKSQRIVSLQTMKQMEELLPSNRFIRVHRSYFVAMDKIISVEKQQIQVKDKIIPIGSIYQSLFMKKLTKISTQ